MAQRAELKTIRPNRIPPHNLDAEQSVLGAMLESRDAVANVLEAGVQTEDFYKPGHAEIFDAILAIFNRSERPDALTLAEELNRRGTLDEVGGKPYITGLLDAYPTASSATRYARIVEEHARLRRLITAGGEISELGFSIPEDVDQAVDQAEEIVYQVADRRLRDTVQPLKGLLSQSMIDLEKLYERGESITGTGSGFADLDDMTSGFQPSNLIMVAARPSMGKCLAAGTKVVDASTGEQIAIERFVAERRSSILGIGTDGDVAPREVTDWIPNGRKPCFQLRTRSGRTIEVTDNHPFLTIDGWTPLSELRPGRKIAVPGFVGTFGEGVGWNLGKVRLLAYFIAEGNLTNRCPRFTNFDQEIVKDFCLEVERQFPTCVVTSSKGGCYSVPKRIPGLTPSEISLWLRELGLMGKRAEAKSFPGPVWQFSQPQLAEFLKALFSCDGTIYPMGGYGRIEFTVASEHLAEDVRHALLRFGIVSRLWQKTERSWRVEITDPESVQIYQTSIGWIGEKATRSFRETPGPRRSNTGYVPKEVWELVKKACYQRSISLAELSRRAGEDMRNVHTNRGISSMRLRRYADILDDDDLRWLSNPDLYWDSVQSIEPAGEKEVFDLTVPDGNNFVAEDIVVHNSALLGDFALHVAVRERRPVVIFNLEMSRYELTKRFMSSEARVDSQRIAKGTLQEQDWARLGAAVGRLAEAPIYIDDSANITLMEIRAKCRRIKAREKNLGLVIIDYLQLMQSPRKSENRQQEVSEISRNLKILARELEIPVVCAAQLNRSVEYRADKRPLLGDLRESGSLEQDSDLVMFIYRDEVYNPDTEARGEAELIVAKHRNGPTGTVRLAFMNQYTKFASLARSAGL